MRKPASLDTCLAEADARDGGHSARSERNLRRLRDGNVTVNASVSMIQPNTSRRVSQSVRLLVDKRGGSDTPLSPNKRKWSDANDCTALKQTATIGPPLALDENTIINVVKHEEAAPGIAARTRDGATITREHHRNPPRRGNSNMRDGCGPLGTQRRLEM